MTNLITAFVGSTELSIVDTDLQKTNDTVVNQFKIEIIPETDVTNSSIIQIRESDGVTLILSARVVDINQDTTWLLTCFSNGYELQNLWIEDVYEGVSPEAVVQDIIDNKTTTLTFSSTAVSGFTIQKYIAKGYAADIIKEMMTILDWQLRIDKNDYVYFETKGNINNGLTLTSGTDGFYVTKWREEKLTQFVNRVRIKGGQENKATQETFVATASQTTFTLTNKPSGVVRITDNGTEVTPTPGGGGFEVDSENKQIIFEVGRTVGHTIIVFYSYNIPVIVDYPDNSSIISHLEVFKQIELPGINSFSEARKYAYSFIDASSSPSVDASGFEVGLKFSDREVGETVIVDDPQRNRSATLVISKIIFSYSDGKTTYEFGNREFLFYDWQAEVQDRIKKLEKKTNDEEQVIFARLSKHNVDVQLTKTNVWEWNTPKDSFILGHPTLGRCRSTLSFEADCSDNPTTHHGTWEGTGVYSGDQYTTDGYRLSAAHPNGTDHYCVVSHNSELNARKGLSISFFIKKGTSNNSTYFINKVNDPFTDGFAIGIDSNDKLIVTFKKMETLTATSTTTITTDDWFHVVVIFSTDKAVKLYINGTFEDDSSIGSLLTTTNTSDLYIGRVTQTGTTYYDFLIDEFMMFDVELTSAQISSISNKTYDIRSVPFSQLTNCLIYLSFDNPRLGYRETTRQTVS